ncbi:DegT/DnrJ/EryC1/StrS aminotransferase family protein [Streptomyces sp. NBC_01420]|uniref:DegT/DnrJ/EryC1/StrS family aminotransferase n=1 Tax=Streptomyces sp. NBC_01420 TaxID=2903858 RepID=UPI00324CBB8A
MADLRALNETRWPPPPSPSTIHNVQEAMASRQWTGGRYTREAEDALCEVTGAPYAVAFQSCTAAIHAALLASGARAGTPLHTPAFGFAGTLTGAAHIGMELVYHDVHGGTGNSIDPEAPDGTIVLTPDLHGVPHTLDRSTVITDACQSLGTTINGKPIGAEGTHCWSFSSSKLIAAPDGGAVTTDDRTLADVLRQLRDYGAEPGAARANALITRPGHNWRPSELSMAIVADQLRRLPVLAARAQETGERVQTALRETGLWHQETADGVEPAWHKLRTGLPGRARSGLLRLALTDLGMPWHDWGTHPLPQHPQFWPSHRNPEPVIETASALAARTFCLGTEACPPWTWTTGETELVCAILDMITETL